MQPVRPPHTAVHGEDSTDLDATKGVMPEGVAVTRRSLRQRLRRNRLARYMLFNPTTLIGVVITLVVIVLTVIGPLITPSSPTSVDLLNNPVFGGPPSGGHWFGTDDTGYDIYSRVLAGAQLSVGSSATVVGIAVVVGLFLGAIAGFVGGWVDELLMRITDIFLAFPVLILALGIAASLGPGLGSCVIALAVGFWPWYTRLLRGQVLALKHREYVEASRALGASPAGIIWRHILPNAISPLIVQVSLDMGNAVLAIASLSYIGIGAQPPSPEWGAMIVAGREFLRTEWWTCVFPGIALSLAVLGFNLVGDGLRDALDPRSSR